LMLTILAIIPLTMAVFASMLWRPVLLFRGLIGSAPALYLLIALAIESPRGRTWLITAMTVPVITAGLFGFYKYNPLNKGDTIGMILTVASQWQPGDLIVHANDGSMVGWMAYAPMFPQVRMPSCDREPEGALSNQTRQALGLIGSNPAMIPHNRLWVIWSLGPTSPQCEVDQMQQLIDSAKTILITRDDDFVRSGIWLISN